MLRFVEALDHKVNEMHSFMLLRHGSVVAEGWWAPYRSEHPHLLFSLSKSFTSTAVGLAVAEGRFSIDDPVLAFFPEETPEEKCSSLALPPVQGKAVSPLAAQVSGRIYRVDENEFHIATITLDFSPSGGTVRVDTGAGEETIPGGYGVWQRGQTSVFNPAELNGQTPVFASGAWTAEDSFTLVVRLYETPFYYTCGFHFAGDELLIESRINVSLEASKTWLLTARCQP